MVNFYEAGANQTRSLEHKSNAARTGCGSQLQIARLAGWLALAVLGAALCSTARAAQGMSLSWQGSSDPSVTGYNVYFGGASGNYTNEVSLGNVTTTTIPGLNPGTTYYFAATAVDASGTESGYSTEISYTVPVAGQAQLQVGTLVGGIFALAGVGTPGHTYEILASTNLISWTAIGTQLANSNGSFQFNDSSAGSFPARFYRTLDIQQ